MRVIALLATYNEARFIESCIGTLAAHGVDVYLIDNSSTDETVSLAERHRGKGLVGIETVPRDGCFRLEDTLRRKEELAASLDADWFMHVDADEIRLPPRPGGTLGEALAEVDAAGFDCVNFLELTFVPTRESPDHDHPRYLETMRWYYPFLPFFPHRVNAWKRQPGRVDLVGSGGHRVRFEGQRMFPESFHMKHYQFLSVPHAIQKYVDRAFDPKEVEAGWHGWRAGLTPESIALPSQDALRTCGPDGVLDTSRPRKKHVLSLGAAAGKRP
jgi:glycosyltransferase involved in cell wall biosynthesis